MNYELLNEIEKAIYKACYEKPKTTYDIISDLSKEQINVSYAVVCQKCGILVSKGFLNKSNFGKKIYFKSIDDGK